MGKLSVVFLSGALVGAIMVVLMIGGLDDVGARRKACPPGTTRFVRVCIEKDARPADSFANATADCAADKRRLLTTAELDAFRQQPGVALGGTLHWTGTLVDSNIAITLNNAGVAFQNSTTGFNAVYRCVA
jgi:hypothetical protein